MRVFQVPLNKKVVLVYVLKINKIKTWLKNYVTRDSHWGHLWVCYWIPTYEFNVYDRIKEIAFFHCWEKNLTLSGDCSMRKIFPTKGPWYIRYSFLKGNIFKAKLCLIALWYIFWYNFLNLMIQFSVLNYRI